MIKVEKVKALDLFKTPKFRNNVWVRELCARLGSVWITPDKLAYGHFGTMFGALEARTYPDLIMQDLYRLHELWHLATMPRIANMKWLNWTEGLIQSEFEASMASECMVYFHIPRLRENTFAHEIWVDQFLRSPLAKKPVIQVEQKIREERTRALHSPRFNSFLEHQIQNYDRQNQEWCAIWAGNVGYGLYGDVPAFWTILQHMYGGDDLTKTHVQWLRDVTLWPDQAEDIDRTLIPPGVDVDTLVGQPFAIQAARFIPVLQWSHDHFGNWLLGI